ncbi:sugar-binding protein [Candidatus Omnitrophota bacterium]
MKKYLILFFLVFIFVLNSSYALEIYNSVYIEGKAPIIIDGIISDWDGLELQLLPLQHYQNLINNSSDMPQHEDLSAHFKCFADADFVYVAVMVNDDNVIIGNHIFGEGWNDDSVEICFDGDSATTNKSFFDTNDGQLRIQGNPLGVPYIEGIIPYLYIAQIPYYWEARGVRCGFSKTNTGYNVEVAIPLEVLEWENVTSGNSIGVNVRILEDDNEENGEFCDSVLSWSFDPDKSSWWKTDRFNRIQFNELVTMDGMTIHQESSTLSIVNNQEWELALGLNAPESKGYNDVMTSVFSDFAKNDWGEAEVKLEPLKDRLWAKLLIGVIQFHENKYTEGVLEFAQFSQQCSDEFAALWAKEYPYLFAKELIMSEELYERLNKRHIDKGAALLHEELKQKPDDIKSQELLLFALDRMGGSGSDYNVIQNILQEPKNEIIDNQATIALARYHYINKNYDEARSLCNNLLQANITSKNKLDITMINLSIDRKLNQK